MSAKKQSKPNKTTNKSKQELSSIGEELLDHCRNHQPVFLYGKDNIGRKDLIRDVHMANGGIDACWEYQGLEKNINSIDDLHKALRKTYEDNEAEKQDSLMLNCHDTTKTYCIIDCGLESGEKVFNRLASFEHKVWYKPTGEIFSSFQHISKIIYDWSLLEREYETPETKEVIQRKGLLFINNLRCEKDNSEDRKWYENLAIKIESLKKRDHSSGGWLVVYAHDPKTFPKYFGDQFELVLLDSKDYEVKQDEGKKTEERKAKQACINCHFLMRMQYFVEEDPLDKEATLVIHDETPVLYNMRGQIENNDYNFNDLDGLGCYKRRWIEVNEEDKQKRYKVVVETDRGGCKYFFENNWFMSFETGEREWKTLAGLEAYAQSIKKVVKRQEAEPKNNKKKKSTKLIGKKKHYSPPATRKELINKYLKEFPDETRHVIALKVKKSLEEKGGRSLKISTLKKDISHYRKKKKGK